MKKALGINGRIRLPGGSGGTTFFCDKGYGLFATKDQTI